ncbi:MAG: FG-GAP-like repeat-containing protein [Planctomycetota bacterium]|nr:FG-GAP-like repeat-containing protein [Planctomycetota bacterium]
MRATSALALFALAGGAPAMGQFTLTNVTGVSGVSNTQALAGGGGGPMRSGVAAGDFNNDGYPDIFLPSDGTAPDKLFINNQDGTFTNAAAAWGLTAVYSGTGVCVGDYDKDGWLDVFVTSHGDSVGGTEPGSNRLYRNNGDGTFSEVAAAAGVNFQSSGAWGFGCAFGDYDLDGDLDLWASSWNPGGSDGNRLYQNNGDGTFTDVTVAAGVFDPTVWGFSPRMVDMNGDGLPELVNTGDFSTSRYYINNGDGTFTDGTIAANVNQDQNGMGSTVADVNNDGLLDWYVTSIFSNDGTLHGNKLYINQGNDTFLEVAAAANADDGGWGWGTTAVDMNLDGFVDLMETNGWPADGATSEWEVERCKAFMNNGDGTFTEEAATCGLSHDMQGRGIINLDFDLDGDQDLVVVSFNDELRIYRTEMNGSPNGYLRLTFDTSTDPRMAPNGYGVFARVTIGGQTQVRCLDAGSNYLSQSEQSVHFGLGTASVIDELRIDWPNGRVSTFTNVAVNQVMTIVAPVPADLNADGLINSADLGALLGSWGPSDDFHDLNGDGLVNSADLGILLGSWM